MSMHLIIVGSPYTEGKSTRLAQRIAAHFREEDPLAEAVLFGVGDHAVNPCTSCDGCKGTRHCVIEDDMQELYGLLDDADDVTVVTPVFFAGPPAQLKALYDRMQLYFWTDVRKQPKRPAQLYVIGSGGDPHGFEPLVTITRSALAVAGFKLGEVHDRVGQSLEDLDV